MPLTVQAKKSMLTSAPALAVLNTVALAAWAMAAAPIAATPAT